MPELPEVQCFVNDINRNYAGAQIAGVRLHRADLRRALDREELARVFARGNHLVRAERIGKRLVLRTESGAFLVSLGMSGAFHPGVAGKCMLHEHVTIEFADGRCLAFVDPRRFGDWAPYDGSWGAGVVDGLDAAGLARLFRSEAVCRSQRPVKAMLLDQNLIGGVGNIYALEALFMARIHPEMPCSRVLPESWKSLAKALPEIFRRAIEAGGSTISSYVRLSHAEGGFQESHLVYAREGEPCRRRGCRGVVMRIEQGGRSSWFCPVCQPAFRVRRTR